MIEKSTAEIEYTQAVRRRQDELIAEATTLEAETWRQLKAGGLGHDFIKDLALELGAPPNERIPFARIFPALADHIEQQAVVLRKMAAEWEAWGQKGEDLVDEIRMVAKTLEGSEVPS
jgi:hypothetical protein